MSEKLTIPVGKIFDPQFSATMLWLSSARLPAKVSYWLGRVLAAMHEAEKTANSARLSVFKEHGKEVKEEGKEGAWTLEGCDEVTMERATQELKELAEEPLELPISEKIVLPEHFEITAVQMQIVEPIITVEGIEE